MKIRTKILLLFTIINFQLGYAQFSIDSKKETHKIRLEIENFNSMLPYCGNLNTVSFYRARILDNLNVVLGKEIIVYVYCKADRFPNLFSKIIDAEIIASDNQWKDKSIYNFTNISDKMLSFQKMYELVNIKL